jgi:hypothetical protein
VARLAGVAADDVAAVGRAKRPRRFDLNKTEVKWLGQGPAKLPPRGAPQQPAPQYLGGISEQVGRQK